MFLGSVVALITPLKNDQVDIEALQKLIEFHETSKTHACVILGSTGQGMLLSKAERNTVISASLEASKTLPIIVGCGGTSTHQALLQVKQAQNLNAQGVLLVTPPYSKANREGMIQYFRSIHDQTHIPIILYNNPSRTGIDLHIDDIESLSQLERIVGIKEASLDHLRPFILRKKCRNTFKIFAGDDVLISSFLVHGADGMISVAGNISPTSFVDLYESFKRFDMHAFYHHYQKIMLLINALQGDTNPSPVQYALSLLGKCTSELRSPLVLASKAVQVKISEALKNYFE